MRGIATHQRNSFRRRYGNASAFASAQRKSFRRRYGNASAFASAQRKSFRRRYGNASAFASAQRKSFRRQSLYLFAPADCSCNAKRSRRLQRQTASPHCTCRLRLQIALACRTLANCTRRLHLRTALADCACRLHAQPAPADCARRLRQHLQTARAKCLRWPFMMVQSWRRVPPDFCACCRLLSCGRRPFPSILVKIPARGHAARPFCPQYLHGAKDNKSQESARRLHLRTACTRKLRAQIALADCICELHSQTDCTCKLHARVDCICALHLQTAPANCAQELRSQIAPADAHPPPWERNPRTPGLQ